MPREIFVEKKSSQADDVEIMSLKKLMRLMMCLMMSSVNGAFKGFINKKLK